MNTTDKIDKYLVESKQSQMFKKNKDNIKKTTKKILSELGKIEKTIEKIDNSIGGSTLFDKSLEYLNNAIVSLNEFEYGTSQALTELEYSENNIDDLFMKKYGWKPK